MSSKEPPDCWRGRRRLCPPRARTPRSRAPTVPTLNTKPLFKLMVEKKASDLFFTSNAPIKIKIEGQIFPVNKQVLSPETVRQTALALMNARAARVTSCASGKSTSRSRSRASGRFRVNVFMQRGYPALVMRYITADMPRLDVARPAGGHARPHHGQARPGDDGRRHGLGQVHLDRGDDQLPQRELLGSHRHHRGSHRVPAHEQALDREPARSGPRHQVLCARPARRHARGAGRHPHR